MTPRAPSHSGTDYVRFSDQLTDSLDQITALIESNREIIDTVQDVAIQLTDVFGNLHTLTLKYAGVVNKVLDAILSVIDKIPFISDKVVDLLKDIERLTQNIIDSSDETARIIQDVDAGLRKGDMERLKAHTGDLKKVTRKLQAILPD